MNNPEVGEALVRNDGTSGNLMANTVTQFDSLDSTLPLYRKIRLGHPDDDYDNSRYNVIILDSGSGVNVIKHSHPLARRGMRPIDNIKLEGLTGAAQPLGLVDIRIHLTPLVNRVATFFVIENANTLIGWPLCKALGLKLDGEEDSAFIDGTPVGIGLGVNCLKLTFENPGDHDEIDSEEGSIFQNTKPDPVTDISAQIDVAPECVRAKLRALMEKYKSLGDSGIGILPRTLTVSQRFHSEVPVLPYTPRYSEEQASAIHSEFKKLQDLGVLAETNEVSPTMGTFLIAKKSGGQRVICDARPVNRNTIKETQNLPDLNQIIEQLPGREYYVSLDISSAYFHYSLDDESASKFLVLDPISKKVLKFMRLPMGASNSGQLFQKALDTVLLPVRQKYTNVLLVSYIDDVVISADDPMMLLRAFEMVLDQLDKNNLRIKLSKTHLFTRRLNNFGYIIDRSGRWPDTTRIQGFIDAERPRDRKQLLSLLCGLNYFRSSFPQWAKHTSPLYIESSKKPQNGEIDWTDPTLDTAYKNMIESVAKAVKLGPVDPKEAFTITTDASVKGLGATVSQAGMPVALYSSKLSPAQANYSVGLLELLCLYRTLNRYHYWFSVSKSVTCVTDSKYLVFVYNSDIKKTSLGRAQAIRMLTYLSSFNLKVVHKSGQSADLLLADTLSRMQTPPSFPILVIGTKNNEPLATLQQDPEHEQVERSFQVNVVTRSRAKIQPPKAAQNDSENDNESKTEVVKTSNGSTRGAVTDDAVVNGDTGSDDKEGKSNYKFDTAEISPETGDVVTHIQMELTGNNKKTEELLDLITQAQLTTKSCRQRIEMLRRGVSKCNHRGHKPCEHSDCVLMKNVEELAQKFKVNKHGQLFRVFGDTYKLVVPDSVKQTVIEKLHGEHHRGVAATVELVKRNQLFVHQLIATTVSVVRSCEVCSVAKDGKTERLNTSEQKTASRPFATVSADILQFTINNEQKHVLVAICHFSGFLMAQLLRGSLSRHVKNGFYSMWARTSTPQSLKTDNGSNFTSEECKSMYATMNVHHSTISANNSRANSRVENANKRILDMVRTLNGGADITSEFDLEVLLNNALLLLNAQTAANGMSPFLVVTGYIPGFVYGVSSTQHAKEVSTTNGPEYYEELERIRQKCQEQLLMKAAKGASNTTKIKPGDHVRIRLRKTNKHLKKYSTEVYRVIDVRRNCLKLQLVVTFNGSKIRGTIRRVHARFTKKCEDPTENEETEAPPRR